MLHPNSQGLYDGLAWPFMEDEVPSFEAVELAIERIFLEFACTQGLEDHWRRSIWKAVVTD